MEHVELVLLFLLVVVAALSALARVIGVPYPILLVVGGAFVGFAPGVPDVELEPDLVLLIFLPPLLFNAAYFSSLRDLRANARGITLSAIGLVLLTSACRRSRPRDDRWAALGRGLRAGRDRLPRPTRSRRRRSRGASACRGGWWRSSRARAS